MYLGAAKLTGLIYVRKIPWADGITYQSERRETQVGGHAPHLAVSTFADLNL